MGLKAPSVNGDCCWRWPHPWYLAGWKWHREGGDAGPRGLGGAALAGGVKEQSGGHPRWPRWDCEPWRGRSRGTGQAALERSGGRRGSEPGRRVREVIPLAGLGPWAGDSPRVSPSPSIGGDGRSCTHLAGPRWINGLAQGAAAQSGGSVQGRHCS